MNKKYSAQEGGGTDGFNFQGNKVSLNVDIRSSRSGTALQGTVAHEGDHVSRVVALAQSYNSGKYSASLNLAGRQMEINAFTVQNRVMREFSSASAIERHVVDNYSKKDLEKTIIRPEYTE